MVSFAKVWGRYFSNSVEIIEKQLKISLKGINYYPLWQYGEKEFVYVQELDKEYNLISLEEDIVEWKESWLYEESLRGKAGNKGIYYARPKFTNHLSVIDARQTLFHELYHIGLMKVGGYEDTFSEEREYNSSLILDEGFADMMAIRTMQEYFGLKSKLMYELEVGYLEYLLKINNVSQKPLDIARFVLGKEPIETTKDFYNWLSK